MAGDIDCTGKKLQNVLGKSPVLGNKIGFQIFEIVDQLGENGGNFMYLFPENIIFGHRILANIWYWDVLEFLLVTINQKLTINANLLLPQVAINCSLSLVCPQYWRFVSTRITT